MSNQADFDFGNALVELDLAPLDRVREGLKILRESTRAGDSLERVLLERGVITPDKAAMAHRRLKEAGSGPSRNPEEKGLAGAPEVPGYRIIAELGRGSAGTVYRARQLSMDRTVAIKVLATELAKDHAYLDRFFREAKAAARLSHPNLITAHDVGANKGVFYIVMEYVEGATLQQMLDSRGALDEALVVNVALQVAKALEVAHRHGLVHRDVKPANILLGSTGVAKLCDLGLARQAGGRDSEGRAVGTPRYISPEQARDDAGVDIRSDLYSLGATMYHLVTGQVPFPAQTGPQMLAKHVAERLVPARERNPRVSAELSAVISRLMEKNPAQRIQRPSDLVTALESIKPAPARAPARSREVRPSPATTQVPMPVPRALPPRAYARKRGGGAGKFFAFLVIVGLGAGVWFYREQIGLAIKSRDASKLIPGPLNPTPGPEAAALEEAARKDLEELEESAAQDAAFENLPGVLKRFDDFRRKYRDTKWELQAVDRRESYLKRADLVAQTELESITNTEKELLAANKYRDVYQLYSRFPKKFLQTTQTGEDVRKRLHDLMERISGKFVEDKRQLQELIRQRRYEEAASLIAAMEEYALPDQVLELADRRRALEGHRKAGESAAAIEVRDKYLLIDGKLRDALAVRAYREALGTLTSFLYGSWSEAELPFTRSAGIDYDDLRKEIDAVLAAPDPSAAAGPGEKLLARIGPAIGDPANLAEATTAQMILLDLRNGVSLELFRGRIVEGVEQTLKATSRETWTVAAFGGAKGRYERRGTALYFVPDGGKETPVDLWTRLSESDLEALAARASSPDRAAAESAAQADPIFHLRAGLMHYYAKAGTAGAARARNHFELASKGGVTAVKVYLSDLSLALQRVAEQESAARFEEAKGLVGQGNTAAAKAILEELAKRTGVKFVDEHKDEIEKMLADLEQTLAKGKKLEDTYKGKVETLDAKRLRVTYDFTYPSQGEMFEPVADPKIKGKWRVDRGGLESSGGASVSSAAKWKAQVNGDVEIEYDLVAMEDPQNVTTDLYVKPGSDKYYSVTFALDLVIGDMEEKMRIPNTAVLKYPTDFQRERAKLPAEWDKLRGRLVGATVSDFRLEKRKKVRVKIARIGRKIALAVDGKPAWEGEDGDYNTGYIVFFADCRAQIDNLQITFTP